MLAAQSPVDFPLWPENEQGFDLFIAMSTQLRTAGINGRVPAYVEILLDGFMEQRASALLRTEMEEGPPKQARIRSRVLVTRPATLRVRSRADYLNLVAWFSTTLHEGADWFDFADPVTQTVKQARFVGGGFDATPQSGLATWLIKTQIETWG